MAKLDLKKPVRGLSFFTRSLRFFGGRQKAGDQSVFDRRGAVKITNKEVVNKNGEIFKIRGIDDSGSGSSSMVIPRPSAGASVDSARAMEANHGWPFAAIKAIADEISSIEWRLFKRGTKGDQEIDSHELLDLLESVNNFQTGPEFRQMLVSHLELTGNAYILLMKKGEYVSSYEDKPDSMFLVDPSRVRIVLNKLKFPFIISKYRFTFEGREWAFEPYQIAHIKYPNPSDPYQGLGTIAGIAEWVDNDNNTTEFLRQFFLNGAQLGQVFETDMSSEDQLMELRDSFNEQHTGVRNTAKAIFLPKGVKKPTGDAGQIKIGDIGVPALGDKNRDNVLAGFRLSKTILGTAESDTNRSTAETADYVFAKRTIKPKVTLICSYINEFITTRFGSDIYVTFSDPVTNDKEMANAEMQAAVAGSAVMTINEARSKYLGLDPIEGGDVLLVPNLLTPIDQAGQGPQSPMQLSAKRKDATAVMKALPYSKPVGWRPRAGKSLKTQFSRNAEIRKDMAGTIKDKVKDILASIKRKDIKDMTRQEYDEVILGEKGARTAKYADEMKAALQALNEKQKKEVLKNLEKSIKAHGKKKDIDIAKLLDLDEWISLTINALTPIAVKQFGSESVHALELIGKPGLDISGTPSAKAAITKAMELMSTSYNQNTVNILESKLNEGISQGFGVGKLADLVSDIYAWKDSYAAERVALTESNRIANDAGKIAWKESGVVKQLEWVTSKRDNVCEFCLEQDGKTIDIDDNFFDKGEDIDGSEGGVMTADYSDIGGPPLHPNCHCGMKPIVDTTIEAAARDNSEKEIDEAMQELETLDHEEK